MRGIGLLSAEQCRALLPKAQAAVVEAVAGAERFERIYPDEEGQPAGQLCIDCNQGSEFMQRVTISERCMEFGHHPFGVGPDARWVN